MKFEKIFRNQFSILTCLIIILSGCGTGRNPAPAEEKNQPAFLYYKTAMDFLRNQNYTEALDQMNRAISLKPEFAPFYYARGQILELQGKPNEAISAYEKALLYKSYYPDTWKRLTRLYMDTKQYDKATQILNYLTDSFPDSFQYEIDLADAYVSARKPLLALERVNYFEREGGSSDEILRIKGLAYCQLKEYSKAVSYLEDFVIKHPRDLQALKHLGIALIRTGSAEKGISYLNRALSIDPDDPEIYLYRARYFIQMKKYDTARDQYRLALELDNTSSEVLLESSIFFLNQGNSAVAQKLLENAVHYNSECWECYKWLGMIADENNQREEAIRNLEKYISNIYHRDEQVEKRLDQLKSERDQLKNKP